MLLLSAPLSRFAQESRLVPFFFFTRPVILYTERPSYPRLVLEAVPPVAKPALVTVRTSSSAGWLGRELFTKSPEF